MSAVAFFPSFHVKPLLGRRLRKIRAWFFILTWFISTGALAQAGGGVPLAQDLATEAKEAPQKAVLVLFSRPDCPYCRQVLDEFLIPMSRNAEYQAKVLMRQVEIGGEQKLVDFSGRVSTHRQFSLENRARLAPTVVLFDAEGHVLAEPLVGMITRDYYGAFLDRAIDEALEKIRNRP